MLLSICVYCGSAKGTNPAYQTSAEEVGKFLADNKIRLVYGGGNVGLMGVVSDTAMAHGGEVVGIIPRFLLEREVGHKEITELRVVESMHERKEMMASLADGFLVLSGGIGTLEELFEVFTWRQLDLHQKPIGILNTNGYYNFLISFLENAVTQGFLHESALAYVLIETDAQTLLQKMLAYRPSQAFDKDKI
jgi:uncharacterized protein (TIGR00730 family)